jgi:hypothetical protein
MKCELIQNITQLGAEFVSWFYERSLKVNSLNMGLRQMLLNLRRHSLNPSGRTMALGSTLPLTDMSTGNISWGVKAAGA